MAVDTAVVSGADTAPNASPDRGTRWRAALAPGATHLLIAGLGLLVYWWFAVLNHGNVNLHAWDGDWYIEIARHGYFGVDPTMLDVHGHRNPNTPMVFFPGYPLAVRVFSYVCGGNFLVAAVLVSVVSGTVAAYGIERLTRRVTSSRRAALLAVALSAAAPMSIVFVMAYPEALLCALVAWCLVGIVERKWWLAAVCSIAAGYTSPMAAPLVGVVLVAGFADVYRHGRWPAVIAAACSPAGIVAYLLWTVGATGMRANYFSIQAEGWGSSFDFGWSTATWVMHTFTTDSSAYVVATAALAVVAVALVVVAWRPLRAWWPVWLYCLFTVIMVDGTGGLLWDKGRLLLSGFPLIIPVAAALARARWRVGAAWTVAVALGGLWFSAYALTAWHYSI